MIIIDLPWPHKDLSPNARPHWAEKARLTKRAREGAYYAALAAGLGRVTGEAFRVTTTFNPPARYAYDEDNLKARCKALYDGVSDALGVDDRHFRHAPVIIGEPVKRGNVRIEIEAVDTWQSIGEVVTRVMANVKAQKRGVA